MQQQKGPVCKASRAGGTWKYRKPLRQPGKGNATQVICHCTWRLHGAKDGCVAIKANKVNACTKSAGKIRPDGESIMWEIAGKGERLDIVFPGSHAGPVWGRKSRLPT